MDAPDEEEGEEEFGVAQRRLARERNIVELYRSIRAAPARSPSITWDRSGPDAIPICKESGSRTDVRIAHVIFKRADGVRERVPFLVGEGPSPTLETAIAKVYLRRDLSWHWVAATASARCLVCRDVRSRTKEEREEKEEGSRVVSPGWSPSMAAGGSTCGDWCRMRPLVVCPNGVREERDAVAFVKRSTGCIDPGQWRMDPRHVVLSDTELLGDGFVNESIVSLVVSHIPGVRHHVIRVLGSTVDVVDARRASLFMLFEPGGTLRDFVCRQDRVSPGFVDSDLVTNIIFMFTATTAVLQAEARLKHGDAHDHNVFVRLVVPGMHASLRPPLSDARFPPKETWSEAGMVPSWVTSLFEADIMEYVVGDDVFYVPNMGFLPVLADFGLSSISVFGRRVGRIDIQDYNVRSEGFNFGPWSNSLRGFRGYDLQVFLSSLWTWLSPMSFVIYGNVPPKTDWHLVSPPSRFFAEREFRACSRSDRSRACSRMKRIKEVISRAVKVLDAPPTDPVTGRPKSMEDVSDMPPDRFLHACFRGKTARICNLSRPPSLECVNWWRRRRGLGSLAATARVRVATVMYSRAVPDDTGGD